MNIVRHLLSENDSTRMDTDLSQLTNTSTPNTTVIKISEFYELLNMVAASIETLHDDEQRLNDESLRLQIAVEALSEKLSKAKFNH